MSTTQASMPDAECPICGSDNPCYGNKSVQEIEAEFEDRDDDDDDF